MSRTLMGGAVLSAVAVLLPASWSEAAIVMQQAGSNYIAFEAEIADLGDNDAADDREWAPITDAAASGGAALQAMPGGSSQTSSSAGQQTATYHLAFTEAGTYYLYLRHRTLPEVNPSAANSAFAPNDFGSSPSYDPFDNNGDNADYEYWQEQQYTVEAADLGQTFDFIMSIREDGYVMDRFVLSQESGLDAGQLAALSNSPIPEPGSFALAFASGAMLLGRRKRQIPTS